MSDACQCKACASKRTPTKDAITASGILATEQLGPKQSLLASGALLCQDVPIARIGVQDYAEIELPDIESKDGVIEVERTEDGVFDPEAIASFVGVPVTIEHPREPVTPDNWIVYAKGSVHNVRRGEGEMSDFLLADLLIQDKGAIHDIQTKRLREISCGYDAGYIQIAPGRAQQTSIVGNHVALLAGSARCGEACSVQDSLPTSTGESSMASKKKPSALFDRLRKAFMTKDSEGFEKTLDEMDEESPDGGEGQHIHIHMPGGDKPEETKDDESEAEADPMAKVLAAIDGLAQGVAAIGERVSALESGKTNDSEEEKKDETKDDDGDDESEETNDSDEEEEKKDDEKKSTNDSASFRDEFQDAKARAEILAPGVKLPTFDSKAEGKKTADAICVLRRRALRAGLENSNAELVRAITGDADVSKMDCAAAKMAFHAASELVKQKNKTVARKTTDAAAEATDINKIHADFWANRK